MIGIICFNSLRYAQFVYKYTSILEKEKINFEVIYWDREGSGEEKPHNWISYGERLNTFQPFYKKIFSFVRFVNYLKRVLKYRKYSKLIVLTSQTAVSLYSTLMRKKYKNKFIFDYRDVTYENFFFYKRMINNLIKNSYLTFVSSKGFYEYGYINYVEEKIRISHNSRDISFEYIQKKFVDKKIRIAYWGQVRQVEYNKLICDFFGNNQNFELVYHGAGFDKELSEYVAYKGYTNIKFTGAYSLEDISFFAENTDIILNAYENDRRQAPAMTVKFYDSVKYKLPMIVSKNSYMGKIAENYKIGLAIDFNSPDSADSIISWFKNINYSVLDENFEIIRNKVLNDDEKFKEILLEFVK